MNNPYLCFYIFEGFILINCSSPLHNIIDWNFISFYEGNEHVGHFLQGLTKFSKLDAANNLVAENH